MLKTGIETSNAAETLNAAGADHGAASEGNLANDDGSPTAEEAQLVYGPQNVYISARSRPYWTGREVVDGDKFDHKCPLCGVAFARKFNLKTHIQTHFPERPRIKCDLCHLTFYRGGDLSRHRRVHFVGHKPHVCPRCGKDFARQDRLRVHMETNKCSGPIIKSESLPAPPSSVSAESEAADPSLAAHPPSVTMRHDWRPVQPQPSVFSGSPAGKSAAGSAWDDLSDVGEEDEEERSHRLSAAKSLSALTSAPLSPRPASPYNAQVPAYAPPERRDDAGSANFQEQPFSLPSMRHIPIYGGAHPYYGWNNGSLYPPGWVPPFSTARPYPAEEFAHPAWNPYMYPPSPWMHHSYWWGRGEKQVKTAKSDGTFNNELEATAETGASSA